MATFDKDIGGVNVPSGGGRAVPTTNAGAAAEAIGTIAELGATVYQANEDRKAREAKLAAAGELVDFQTDMIDLENQYISANKREAEIAADLADLSASEMTPQQMEEFKRLQREAEQLQQTRDQLGGMAGYQIRKNLIKKRALNNPVLAGYQDEINKLFGEQAGTDDFVDPIPQAIRDEVINRYGVNYTSDELTRVMREKELLARDASDLALGKITGRKFMTALPGRITLSTQPVMDKMQKLFFEQGLLKAEQINEFNAALDGIESERLAEVNAAFVTAEQRGTPIPLDQQQQARQLIRDELDTVREFMVNKDSVSTMKALTQYQQEAIKFGYPMAAAQGIGIASSGGSGGLMTGITLMNMPESTLAAIDPYGGLLKLEAQKRAELLRVTLEGVQVPEMKNAQITLRKMLFRNGTTEEIEAQTIEDIKEATVINDVSQLRGLDEQLKFLNDPVTRAKVKNSSSKNEVKKIAGNVADSLKRTLVDSDRYQIVINDDGTADLFEVEFSRGEGGKAVKSRGRKTRSTTLDSYNKFIQQYKDLIDVNAVIKVLEGSTGDEPQ